MVSLDSSSGSRDALVSSCTDPAEATGCQTAISENCSASTHGGETLGFSLSYAPFGTLTLTLWPTGELGFMHTGEDKSQYAGAHTVLL